MRSSEKIELKILEERYHSEDLVVDGMIVLKWMLRKRGGRLDHI
jgi:hypothetical protein